MSTKPIVVMHIAKIFGLITSFLTITIKPKKTTNNPIAMYDSIDLDSWKNNANLEAVIRSMNIAAT